MKNLVVLVENFGLNFSGGSTATIHLLKHLQQYFAIHVVAQRIGEHPFEGINFLRYSEKDELKNILEKFDSQNTIGYGDFYIAAAFIDQLPFYFTYHDNWPVMLSYTEDKQWGEQQIAAYQQVFAHAECTFSVSEANLPFIQSHSSSARLVRNGLSQAITKDAMCSRMTNEPLKVIMAGNVDERKYSQALLLFEALNTTEYDLLQVDIYGHNKHKEISARLDEFPMVNLCGFVDELDFKGYHLLLNTSLVENLSLSVVDALANHTPVLAFDVGGLSEAVDGGNGKLIEPFAIDKMKTTLMAFAAGEIETMFDPNRLSAFDWKTSAEIMRQTMLQ